MLDVDQVSVRFGGLLAVDSLSFQVEKKTVHGLIGPNGAGKSTVFNVISGFVTPSRGRVGFAGRSLAGIPPHRRSMLGISRTFQNLELLHSMSVFENVLTACHGHIRSNLLQQAFYWPARRAEQSARTETRTILEKLDLAELADMPVSSLPYGLAKLVAYGRALALRPTLLLLDEPAAGLSDAERGHLADLVRQLTGEGITILLIEHDMGFVMDVCDRITVLDFGRLVYEGAPNEVQNSPEVIRVYLGKGVMPVAGG